MGSISPTLKIKSLKYNGKWDFSPSIESLENLSIKKEYQLFINGQFQKPVGKKYFPSINPSNEQQLSRIAKADSKDVDLAVNSARAAFNMALASEIKGGLETAIEWAKKAQKLGEKKAYNYINILYRRKMDEEKLKQQLN